jgi:hypothetical protein
MSDKPTPTPGGIQRPDIRSSALLNTLIKTMSESKDVPVKADSQSIASMISKQVAANSQKEQHNMRMFNGLVTSFGPTYTILPPPPINIENIGLTFEYMHELQFRIDFTRLYPRHTHAMKGVIFYNQIYPTKKICTLYDLFCYLQNPRLSIAEDSPLQMCIMCNNDEQKYYAMITALTHTFKQKVLQVRTTKKNISYIIERAGVSHEPNAMTPFNLNSAGLRLSSPQGGRGRQRRRGRSLLSRKKRNTRMKKSKKYNKSKKIKN